MRRLTRRMRAAVMDDQGQGAAYWQRVKRLFGANVIGYWPMLDTTGTSAVDRSNGGYNGIYTGATLDQAAAPGGGKCPLFDGTGDNVVVASATVNTALLTAFNGAEGSFIAWARVANAGVWTDAADRRVCRLHKANNYFNLYKHTTNNRLHFETSMGGTYKLITYDGAGGNTDWMLLSMTWSKSRDALKAYVNKAQVGSTATGLGVFAGPLEYMVLGAITVSPVTSWSGWLAHALILNRPATLEEIGRVYDSANF